MRRLGGRSHRPGGSARHGAAHARGGTGQAAGARARRPPGARAPLEAAVMAGELNTLRAEPPARGNAVTTRPPGSPVAVAVAGFVALAIAMGIGRFAFTPVLPM